MKITSALASRSNIVSGHSLHYSSVDFNKSITRILREEEKGERSLSTPTPPHACTVPLEARETPVLSLEIGVSGVITQAICPNTGTTTFIGMDCSCDLIKSSCPIHPIQVLRLCPV
jgi:hypothetical protein